jgi:predicted porin
VAGAILATASVANAGIIIPAGDWTLDIGGNVNTYYTSTRFSKDGGVGTGPLGLGDGDGRSTNNITTGLLPNYLSVSGTTRQNDLDVAFTISINPGASTVAPGRQTSQQENRQAFMTFGDKSWGSVKLGKDLGIYSSDAILNDMTLLGVGAGAGSLAGNTTTLGRIGTGYMYADWKAQIAYTTPNWNGFQATAGVTQAWNATSFAGDTNDYLGISATSSRRGGNSPAFEAKASYSWTGDVAGKVWVSGISQKVRGLTNADDDVLSDKRANAIDIGANVNVAGFGLTGYYYDGKGIGQTMQLMDGFDALGKRRDSKGGYVQATYVIPTRTKLGVSWGRSELDATRNDRIGSLEFRDLQDEMWTVGAYHPLTKHLNLVAEYSDVNRKWDTNAGNAEGKAKTVSLGAILFF